MEDAAEARKELEYNLRQDVKNDALDVHFQPIFDAQTMTMRSVESFGRWHHVKYGLTPPKEFIAIAEEIGIIDQLGDQLLSKAAKQCANWPDHIGLNVNVSPLEFVDNMPAKLQRIIDQIGLSADRVTVEFTEAALMGGNQTKVREQLDQFRNMGVRIALDDFGDGYSSLSHLKDFPIDVVKFDRTFAAKLLGSEQERAYVEAIIKVCESLNIPITVKGVETQAQLEFYRRYSQITRVQGFLFGLPMPSRDLNELVQSQTSTSQKRVSAEHKISMN